MAWQGSLDGLCGPYSIVNAYDLCDIEEDWLGQDIFYIACSEIGNWPEVLWEGTTFKQMRTMLKACQKSLRRAYRKADCAYPIRIEYPFRANPPRSGKEVPEAASQGVFPGRRDLRDRRHGEPGRPLVLLRQAEEGADRLRLGSRGLWRNAPHPAG